MKTNVKTSTRNKKCCWRFKRVRLTLVLFANVMTVMTVDFEMAFWSANNIIAVFLFFLIFILIMISYAIQGKSITWLVNSTLNCTWKPISHESRRTSFFKLVICSRRKIIYTFYLFGDKTERNQVCKRKHWKFSMFNVAIDIR